MNSLVHGIMEVTGEAVTVLIGYVCFKKKFIYEKRTYCGCLHCEVILSLFLSSFGQGLPV